MLGSDRSDDYRSFRTHLHTAYGNARYSSEVVPPWTIIPPRWWVDTTSVDAHRNLPPELRERLLRHRGAA
jgi:hypothetical protein